MNRDQKFYFCKHCGKVLSILKRTNVPTVCCGDEMSELIPNTVDASVEKHVPVISVDGDIVTVTVGSAPHPMIKEHYIEWIYIETEHGGQRKILSPESEPKATFVLSDDKILTAFAYCNLHGLWKAEA